MNAKLDLDRIHYFVTVIECASYTKAAERSGIPKSTLSRNVQALEADVNLRLLNRSTRKLSLTKAGEQFYRNCLPLINDLQKAQAQILDYQQDIQGSLKVTMPAEVGMSFLAEILPNFMEHYPKIQLEIDFSTANHNLIEEGFDLAIRIDKQLADSSYIAKRIATSHLGLFATPRCLQSHSSIQKLEDLKHHVHILVSLSNGYLHIENREPFLRENYQLSTNSMFFNKAICLQDMGIALLPNVLCQNEIKKGELLAVLPDLAIEKPNIYAVYPSRNHPSKALTTFIEFIHQEINKSNGMN
jgi:LysR family transcriptional regulator for bpeEF and oprC